MRRPRCESPLHPDDYRESLPPAVWRWSFRGGSVIYLCDEHFHYWWDHYRYSRTLRPVHLDQYDETRRWFHWAIRDSLIPA